MKRYHAVVAVELAVLISSSAVCGTTHFASPTAVGANSCNDWGNACTLTDAVDAAQAGDEVWATAGTYDLGGSLLLKSGVRIVGGFSGDESAASASKPSVNPSIIDGGRARRVVLSNGNDAGTLLRGFQIAGGWEGSSFLAQEGGGALKAVNSSALFVDCVFYESTSGTFGGGAVIRGAEGPTFVNCVFRNNGFDPALPPDPLRLVYAGGAVYIDDSSPKFVNCLFHHNKAAEAAAVAVRSGSPEFINCSVTNNQATIGYGGGLYDPVGFTTIRNSIFWGNAAVRGAPQLGAHSGRTITVSDCTIQGGYPGTNVMDVDPLFVPGTTDYRLQMPSPCLDAGNSAALPTDTGDLDWDGASGEQLPHDLDGLVRTVGASVDMGAYEFRACVIDDDCAGGNACCVGVCAECCDDSDCDDGVYCNGPETCAANTCAAGTDPCDPGEICYETTGTCGCAVDGDCDDGIFCNGPEVCNSGACQSGGDPCPGQVCDGAVGECVECVTSDDCEGDTQCCSGYCQECCDNLDCPGTGNICCPSQGFVCSLTCPQ